MTLLGSLFAAVSGLNSQGRSLGAISDNISNVSTIGYKGGGVRFSSLVTGKTSAATFSPGGVQAKLFSNIESQGLLQPSQSTTDLAINGGGFFIVKETSGSSGTEAPLYSRAGSFSIDNDGFLKNSSGFFLQGWELDANGNIIGGDLASVKPINFANQTNASRATSTIDISMNLPATDDVSGTPNGTPPRDMDILVYDTLGVAHNVKLRWTRITVPGGAPAGSSASWQPSIVSMTEASTGNPSLAAGLPALTTNGTSSDITFDANGNPNIDPDFTLNFTGLTLNSGGVIGDNSPNMGNITVEMGSLGTAGGITMNSTEYVPKSVTQNGVPFGTLDNVVITETGIVRVVFTNGSKQDMFQIPIATFNDPRSLVEVTGNAYKTDDNAGNVLLQQATVGGAGKIVAGALEASTVDIAEEFTNMIITQRAYSANARIITTSNELLDELIRIV